MSKILQRHFIDDRISIKDLADMLQFDRVGMVDTCVHERKLFFPLFAHFSGASFFGLIVISIGYRFSCNNFLENLPTLKCVFLIISSCYSFMDGYKIWDGGRIEH